MILILNNIRSLHNVGSIFRTADSAGVKKIYLCGISPSPLDRFRNIRPQIAKTALGAEKSVAWEKITDANKLVDKLKKQNYQIIAVEQAKNSVPYFGFTPKNLKKTALIFGAEIEGVEEKILKKADIIIEIPMSGIKESLNVSVSVGIILFHLRDRKK